MKIIINGKDAVLKKGASFEFVTENLLAQKEQFTFCREFQGIISDTFDRYEEKMIQKIWCM